MLWVISLSPWLSLLARCTHEQSSRGGRDGSRVWAQQHRLSSRKLTWLQLLLSSAKCQRPTLSPRSGTFPGVTSQQPGGGLTTSDPFLRWKGGALWSCFVLTGRHALERHRRNRQRLELLFHHESTAVSVIRLLEQHNLYLPASPPNLPHVNLRPTQ